MGARGGGGSRGGRAGGGGGISAGLRTALSNAADSTISNFSVLQKNAYKKVTALGFGKEEAAYIVKFTWNSTPKDSSWGHVKDWGTKENQKLLQSLAIERGNRLQYFKGQVVGSPKNAKKLLSYLKGA